MRRPHSLDVRHKDMKHIATSLCLTLGFAIIALSESTHSELEHRLKSIIVPRIEFREANVLDVLHFLFDAADSSSPEHRPSISLSGIITNEPPRVVYEYRTEHGKPADLKPKTITLNMGRTSLYDLIAYVTTLVDLSFVIENNQLIFVTADGHRIIRQRASNKRMESAFSDTSEK